MPNWRLFVLAGFAGLNVTAARIFPHYQMLFSGIAGGLIAASWYMGAANRKK